MPAPDPNTRAVTARLKAVVIKYPAAAGTCRATMRMSRMYGGCFTPGRTPTSSASSPRCVAATERSASTTSSCCAGSRDAGHLTAGPRPNCFISRKARRAGCAGQRSRHPTIGWLAGTRVSSLLPRSPRRTMSGVGEESVRLRLIVLVIKEMNRDGEAVTVTNRGRPVAVLSPVPVSEETHSAFFGMMNAGAILTRGIGAKFRPGLVDVVRLTERRPRSSSSLPPA